MEDNLTISSFVTSEPIQDCIIAEGGTEPGVIMAEINPAEVASARARIPSLQHGRRFEIVEPLAEPAHLHVVRRVE